MYITLINFSLALFWSVCLAAQLDLQWDLIRQDNVAIQFNALAPSDDGGVVVLRSTNGEFEGSFGNRDGYIAKYDANGALVWDLVYGGSNTENLNSICPTSDGGFIVAGSSNSSNGLLDWLSSSSGLKGIIIKFDRDGNVEWTQSNFQNSNIISVKVDKDDNVYTIQSSGSLTSAQVTVSKYNADGDHLWLNAIDVGDYTKFADVAIDDEGNVYRMNYQSIGSGNGKIIITKFDSEGSEIWLSEFGGGSLAAAFVIEEHEGMLKVGGTSRAMTGDFVTLYGGSDAYIATIDFDGNLTNYKNYGGTGSDAIYDMYIDGAKIFVTGQSSSTDNDFNVPFPGFSQDIFLAELDQNDNLIWVDYSGGSSSDGPSEIVVTSDSNIVVGYNSLSEDGALEGAMSGNSSYLAYYGYQDIVSVNDFEEVPFSVFPNPSTQKISLELDDVRLYSLMIYGTNGALLMHKKLLKEKEIDISNLPSGLLHITLYRDGRKVNTQSVLKE